MSAKADANTLELVVQDDGKGFHPPTHFLAKKKRDGLGNMQHRAETIGGRLEFRTLPGNGTEVRLIVNLTRIITNELRKYPDWIRMNKKLTQPANSGASPHIHVVAKRTERGHLVSEPENSVKNVTIRVARRG